MTARSVQPSRAGTVPWPDELVARYIAEGYWQGKPLAERVYTAADATPDAVALIDGDVRLTYAELISIVDGTALRLRSLGLRGDDRVVVQLPNCWEFVVFTLACLRLGVIPVMALPAHRRHELSYIAEHAEARAIVVPDVIKGFDHQAMATDIRDKVECLEHVLVAGSTVRPGSVDLREMCRPTADPAAARASLDAAPPDSQSVALLLLSGGTTGLPKLIARTHDDYSCYARQTALVCRFDTHTSYLAILPLGHSMTLGGVLAVLGVGGRLVIGGSPSPEQVFATIERERVTNTAAVPAIAQRWLEFREDNTSHDLSSLELLLVGGARLPDHIAVRVKPILSCVLQQGYGMAEGLINLTRLDDPDEVTCNTQGRPICDRDEIRLVDEDGQPVAPGEPGELLTIGPCTPRGYYRAEDHNSRAFVDGWFRSGDIVRQRPDGNLIVEGRAKDLINRGGEKISAEEVENFAYEVEGVSLAAAVAMFDAELGERVCLFVVAREGRTVSLDDVRGVMEEAGVARFKLPERLVLVDALPTTNIGKIDKKALRADIDERLAIERATAVTQGEGEPRVPGQGGPAYRPAAPADAQ